jgi:hypothetical protein
MGVPSVSNFSLKMEAKWGSSCASVLLPPPLQNSVSKLFKLFAHNKRGGLRMHLDEVAKRPKCFHRRSVLGSPLAGNRVETGHLRALAARTWI